MCATPRLKLVVMAVLIGVFLCGAALADPPRTITYQGMLYDSGGNPIDGYRQVTCRLYASSGANTALWSETHSNVKITQGVFTIEMGSFTDLTLAFDQQYWLGIQVTGDSEMLPRKPLTSAPYALNAASASQGDWLDSVAGAGLVMSGSGTSASLALSYGGTGSAITAARSDHNHDTRYVDQDGDLDMTGGFIITDGYLEASHSTVADVLDVRNAGAGRAGLFITTSTTSSSETLYASTQGNGDGVYGRTTGGGRAGHFKVYNSSNGAEAVYAEHNGTGAALLATTTGTGHAGMINADNSANDQSALLVTHNGTGNGMTVTQSGTGDGGLFEITTAGSYADTLTAKTMGRGNSGRFVNTNSANSNATVYATTNGSGAAVYGKNTGTGRGGYFQVYNTSNQEEALYAVTNTSNWYCANFESTNVGNTQYALRVENRASQSAKAALFLGDVYISGDLVKTSGSFTQPHPSDPAKEVVYAFFEGPEHAVFLRGRARLVNGRAEIVTPEHFRVVAAEEGIRIQLTPLNLASKGLAAYSISRERIMVGELMEGQGSYEFDYFITARRDGFQAHEPIQRNVHFTANGMSPADFQRLHARDDLGARATRALLIKNGILNPDGSLNLTTARDLGWKLAQETEALAAKE